MEQEMESQNPAMPRQRFALRAAIIEAGFLSRVLSGFIFPSGRAQRLIANRLGMTLHELRRLL